MPPITLTDLPYAGHSFEFKGTQFDNLPASMLFFDGPPGSGPRLHSHPYAELFLIQEGEAMFVVGDELVTASAGQILIAPAGVPHKFTNTGSGPFRSIDIHLSDHFITEWLEADPDLPA